MTALMPVFTIKAKDALALEAVAAYRDLCTKYELHGQAAEVQLALNEIELWQQDHEDEMRLPSHRHVPAGPEAAAQARLAAGCPAWGPGSGYVHVSKLEYERLVDESR